MNYPSLEQYNEALQYPAAALQDQVLATGSIAKTGLGLPRALCGGFALTYTVTASQKKFAVRCFHKQSKNLEQRYLAIATRLKSIHSNYFVDFEFQKNGIRVLQNTFPVVKMAWATGETLAEFVESNYKNKAVIECLINSIVELSAFLSNNSIAHGDLQPENVMVSNGGKGLQLIDYDGMYVAEIQSLGSAELGQRNFQHPERSEKTWDATLDRFSFISLYVSLKVLAYIPSMWDITQSDQAAIIFRANDYANPENADCFRKLINDSNVSQLINSFIAICKSPISSVPTLQDFIAGRNIPAIAIKIVSRSIESVKSTYVSAYSVVDATDFALCLSKVGDVVELVGQIVEVKRNSTRHGKPYIFINFGPWKGRIVKLSIWSEGVAAIKNLPTESWVGKWVSVIGLMEPPYVNRKLGYEHLSITVGQANQLKVISASEAAFRLTGGALPVRTTNRKIIDEMQGTSHPSPLSGIGNGLTPPISPNQRVLVGMRGIVGGSAHPTAPKALPPARSVPPVMKQTKDFCFVATAAYQDIDHPDVLYLRSFRDEVLNSSCIGRTFVASYYKIGKLLAYPVTKFVTIQHTTRSIIALTVRLLKRFYQRGR